MTKKTAEMKKAQTTNNAKTEKAAPKAAPAKAPKVTKPPKETPVVKETSAVTTDKLVVGSTYHVVYDRHTMNPQKNDGVDYWKNASATLEAKYTGFAEESKEWAFSAGLKDSIGRDIFICFDDAKEVARYVFEKASDARASRVETNERYLRGWVKSTLHAFDVATIVTGPREAFDKWRLDAKTPMADIAQGARILTRDDATRLVGADGAKRRSLGEIRTKVETGDVSLASILRPYAEAAKAAAAPEKPVKEGEEKAAKTNKAA